MGSFFTEHWVLRFREMSRQIKDPVFMGRMGDNRNLSEARMGQMAGERGPGAALWKEGGQGHPAQRARRKACWAGGVC